MFAGYIVLCFGFSLVSSFIVHPKDQSTFVLGSQDANWWRKATIYQIYVKSFKDSDKDGIGDLKGILENFDYIQNLGVQAIWLSPIFESPQKDNGYDISDYKKIWAKFGTLEDFQKLVKRAHDANLKVIIDFVPNHTSDQHDWFQKSAKGDKTYADYYVWRNCSVGKTGNITYPNNWRSVFGGSAWTYNKDRNQCYLHQFLKEQPDLNYTNTKVVDEMKDILKFWMITNGIDGVRIDAVPHIFEDSKFLDEPVRDEKDDTFNGLNHIYTQDQPETFKLIQEFRKYLDNITNSTGIEFTEATNLKYYGDGKINGAHFTFNFQFLGLNEKSTAEDIGKMIENHMTNLRDISPEYVPNWVLGNHDTHRIASKVGIDRIDGLNMLTGYLPGIQVTYQGEEIGMTDGNFTCTEGDDFKNNCTLYPIVTRDFERTPFQWSREMNAGFSKGNTTWLPVAYNYQTVNVEIEKNFTTSHLNIYQKLQRIRSSTTNSSNIVKIISHDDKQILHLSRAFNSTLAYDYLFNFGGGSKNVTVLVKKGNIIVALASGNTKTKTDLLPETFTLDPYASVMIFYTPRSSAVTTSFSLLLVLILGLLNLI